MYYLIGDIMNKKGMMMGGYIMALIVGIVIGAGLVYYLSSQGMLPF